MQSHPPLNRDFVISTLKQEYISTLSEYDNNMISEIETIKSKYATLQSELKIHYESVVKKLHAMYDAYEVTIAQLAAYRNIDDSIASNKLESTLLEFPQFAKYRLNTSIDPIDDIDTINIELNYDIYNDVYSVFDGYLCTNDTGSYIATIYFDAIKHDYVVTINTDEYFTNIKALVINELDIVVLYCIRPIISNDININFIQISTGELVYYDAVKLKDDSRFMYCNNTLFILDSHGDKLYITPYSIDDSMSQVVYKRGTPQKIKFQSEFCKASYQFYGDSRGLYMCYNSIIYFIGNLKEILSNGMVPSILHIIKNYSINVDNTDDTDDTYTFQIININYETSEILLMHRMWDNDGFIYKYYKISLGFIDYIKLF